MADTTPPPYDFTPERVEHHRRIVLAVHRPVPYCEGDVADHAPGCDHMDDARYERLDTGDAPLSADRELTAAYAGPPCVPSPFFEHGVCAGCSYLNSGMPLVNHEGAVPWPCSYVIAAGGPASEGSSRG